MCIKFQFDELKTVEEVWDKNFYCPINLFMNTVYTLIHLTTMVYFKKLKVFIQPEKVQYHL